jgi:hypothetical protein
MVSVCPMRHPSADITMAITNPAVPMTTVAAWATSARSNTLLEPFGTGPVTLSRFAILFHRVHLGE